ncbi:hypothetical protein NPIL_570231 [Nephila pilipes]|uniref:Uncharacterized protein n=1 Tax=Nephila pilipes TaxID=299642 RepID=A0A8X6MX87_NEPPI|nr:hypothetical protein NPIL_570231 [Nephila pilipes]
MSVRANIGMETRRAVHRAQKENVVGLLKEVEADLELIIKETRKMNDENEWQTFIRGIDSSGMLQSLNSQYKSINRAINFLKQSNGFQLKDKVGEVLGSIVYGQSQLRKFLSPFASLISNESASTMHPVGEELIYSSMNSLVSSGKGITIYSTGIPKEQLRIIDGGTDGLFLLHINPTCEWNTASSVDQTISLAKNGVEIQAKISRKVDIVEDRIREPPPPTDTTAISMEKANRQMFANLNLFKKAMIDNLIKPKST